MTQSRSSFRGILFDLDGTLVDSLGDIATSVNLTRADFGYAPLPRDEITRRVGDGSAALVQETVPLPPDRLPEVLERHLANYVDHMLDTTALFPGVAALLDRLRPLPLAVVTNKLERLAESILQGLGIRSRFDLVIGGDSLPRKKPDPAPLLHVATHWGLTPADLVMVGDGLHDLQAARAAGIPSIGVTWGVASHAQLAAEGANAIVNSVDALGKALGLG